MTTQPNTSLDLATAVALARGAARRLLDDQRELRAVAGADEVGSFLLDRTAVAAEHAIGCAMLAEARLAAPGAVVTRAVLEAFFGTYWVSVDEANGRRLMQATRREMLRLMRLNLQGGNGAIRHRETRKDHTQEILRSPAMAEAERLPRFDHMARDVGLQKVYDALYGIMSMFAHGAGTELLTEERRDSLIHAQLHAASAVVRCDHLIVVNRFRHARTTTQDEIAGILQVPL